MELIRDLTVKKRLITITILHDLNITAEYADEVVVLNGGKLVALGDGILDKGKKSEC